MPGGGSFPDFQMAVCSLYPHVVENTERGQAFMSFSIRALIPVHEGSTP